MKKMSKNKISGERKKHMLLPAAAGAVLIIIAAAVRGSGSDEYVSMLERPKIGAGEYTYELEALRDGTREKVTVHVGERQRTREEIDELFEQAEPVLLREMLGENESLDEVVFPLNLVDSLPKLDMRVEWFIEDISKISYWGELSPGESDSDVRIVAVLRYCKETEYEAEFTEREYSFVARLPKRQPEEEALSGIEDLISAADRQYRYEDSIVLPMEHDGEKLSFVRSRRSTSGGLILLPVIVIVLLFVRQRSKGQNKKKKREESLMKDYPEIITKLSLLTGAGMTPYNALIKITEDGRKTPAYEELKKIIRQIQSGTSEYAAYSGFGQHFGLHCYSKLGTLLGQNAVRGNERLRAMLKDEAVDALENRKARARKAGEQAGTKLLMPMLLMLLVVLVIIMVPAFMSF